jgi:integral membrane sensor domain MASE1
MADRSWIRLGKLAAVVLLYVAAGKLGLSMATLHPSASPVWPPTGIAIGALLLIGRWAWPAVALGAFAVNFGIFGHVGSSLGIAAGNTLEAVVAAFLVQRFANGIHAFDRALDLFRYVFLAGIVATLVSPTIGVTTLCIAQEQHWESFGPTWLTWWLGDASGALLVAPPLILWGSNPRTQWTRNQVLEFVAILLAVAVVGDRVFTRILFPELGTLPLMILCMPPSSGRRSGSGPG